MAQSLASILVHLVFSTKRRAPLLPPTPFVELHKYPTASSKRKSAI